MHSIALKVPKSDLTRRGATPTNPASADSVVGVWASASRQAATVREPWSGYVHEAGEWTQVSRLGNPLFNEVLVGMGFKDLWNSLPPSADKRFAAGVQHPELATLLPVLYPGVFPNLAKLTAAARRPRRDPPDRAAVRDRPGLPELHRKHPGRHAAAEPGDPAVVESQASWG